MKNHPGQSLEKSVLYAYQQDGIVDIMAGFLAVMLAVGMHFNRAGVVGGMVPAILLPLYLGLKERITARRIGRVRFLPQREQREQRILKGLIGAGIGVFAALMIVLFVLPGPDTVAWRARLSRFPVLPFGVIFGFLFLVLAFWRNHLRFAGYSVLFLLSVFIGPLLGLTELVYWGVAGLAVLVSGLIVHVRFLKAFPPVKGESE